MPSAFFLPVLLVTPPGNDHLAVFHAWLETRPAGVEISANHPNVRVFNEDGEGLPIELLRDVTGELAYSAYANAPRVVALLHFDAAQGVAQQTLLKTLEEPPTNTLLVLTVEQPEAVLPTIQSRCVIEHWQGSQPQAATDAIPPDFKDLLKKIESGSYADLIDLAENYTDRGVALAMVQGMITYVHQLPATQRSTGQLQTLLETYQQLKKNVNVRLAIEAGFFKMKG